MARRRLFTDEHWASLLAPPTEEREVVRHCTLCCSATFGIPTGHWKLPKSRPRRVARRHQRPPRSLPLPPRLARMVIFAAERGQAKEAAEIAAVMVERGLGGNDPDLAYRLEGLMSPASPSIPTSPTSTALAGAPADSDHARSSGLLEGIVDGR